MLRSKALWVVLLVLALLFAPVETATLAKHLFHSLGQIISAFNLH